MTFSLRRYQVAIIDDDPIAGKLLAQDVVQLGHRVHSQSDSVKKAREEFTVPPDICLMDINLNDITDGIELAVEFRIKNKTPVIFISAEASSDSITRLVAAGFQHILIKPVNIEELKATIEIAVSMNSRYHLTDGFKQGSDVSAQAFDDYIFIKEQGQYIKIKFSDILYLMSSHIYVHVVTSHKEFIVRSSLTEYMNKFPPHLFFRTHRSFVVNIHFIDKITPNSVWVYGKEIPLAQQYREVIMSRIRH